MPPAIVAGALANKPRNGGNAWTRLSWIRGLGRLGFDVYFVEQIDRTSFSGDSLRFFEDVVRNTSMDGRAALLHDDGTGASGLALSDLADVAAAADLLVNIGGHLTIEPLRSLPRCKVYFDDDPGYTQFWHASGAITTAADDYDCYYTIGANIGAASCSIPADSLPWRPLAPPVVLDDWAVSEEGDRDRFTTVASWRGAYGPIEIDGRRYGVKAHEFRKVVDLPRLAQQRFELALDIHAADERDRSLLEERGWHLVDPVDAGGTLDGFRDYVQTSGAEFSVAQGIYVETRSGWFSDRTTRYLASGKPALVQDTGMRLPTGEGLVTFETLEDAVQGAERIANDYDRHAAAARALAEEYFDSDRVLTRLLEDAL